MIGDLDTGGTSEMVMEQNMRNRLIVERLLEFDKDFKLWAIDYLSSETIKIGVIINELNKIWKGIKWPHEDVKYVKLK